MSGRPQDGTAAAGTGPDRRPRLLAGAGAAVLSAVPVVLLALAVRDASAPLVRFDQRVTASTTDFALRHDGVHRAATIAGYLLHPWVFRISVLVAAFVLLRRQARSAALWAASTMALGTLLGAGLKLVVSRARPHLDHPVQVATGYSFPSGHALNAALGVTLLLVLLWRPLAHRGRRAPALALGLLLVLLTGLDRLVLGVHFPTDVTAGWVTGVLLVLSSWVAFGPTMRDRARRGTEQAVTAGTAGTTVTAVTAGTAGTRRPGAADGSLPPVGRLARNLAGHVLGPVLVWLVLLAGVGWLLGHPLARAIAGEDGLNRWFAAHRTPGWNDLTNGISLVANTGTIITTMLVAAAVYWSVSRRPREAVALIAGVSGQALVFLCTTLLIDRPRPQVPQLDVSPPTSSFPSGHTGAATALYVGLVILCLTRLESRPLKVVAAIGFGVIPFLVATARMYRGMHHPSDVIFGLLNGIVCAVIAHRAMRRD